MCNERERLLDYLYDACGPEDRREVERHLESCEACREEVSGLRAVRLNLLAWDVPDRGSVWKPFAPPRLNPWYREVPVWALAAAASVTFVLGMAGGVVSRQLLPARPAQTAVLAPSLTPRVAITPLPSGAELAAMERRILNNVQTQLDRRLQPIAAHAQVSAPSGSLSRDEVAQLVAASEDRESLALKSSIAKMLQDSQRMFVRNTEFKRYINEDLQPRLAYELSQVALQGSKQ